MTPLADKLREARARTGMSQRDVAKSLGISAPSVAQWEIGRSKPKIGRLNAIAALYGIPATSLMGPAPAETDLALETEVITLFRALTPDNQRTILSLIRTLAGKKAA